MIERMIALAVLGCFCILASYAWGTVCGQAHQYHAARPVIITRDAGGECGEDWLCQLQHSDLYRPPRNKH